MQDKKERKQIVITGRIMVRFVSILTIVAVIVFTVITLVRGTPVVELFTEYWVIWIGFLSAILGLLFPDKSK